MPIYIRNQRNLSLGRDIAIALSLANLCLMKAWICINYFLSMDSQYHSQLPPNMNYYYAAILLIFILAAFLWIAMTIARKSRKPAIIKIAKVCFILIINLPVYYILLAVPRTLSIIFIIALIILLLRMLFCFHIDLTGILAKIVLVFFAFFVFNLSVTALKFLRINPIEFNDKQLAKTITINEKKSDRVVWIIFDELDQRITFDDRPANIKLPEFDRFRNQALYAKYAYPPAGETDLSLPSLITGKMISDFKAERPNKFLLNISNEDKYEEWSTISNIFSRAYLIGTNTALIGWYHPYGRIIGDSLTMCAWHPYEVYRSATFSEAIAHQIELILESLPLNEYYRAITEIHIYDDLKQMDRIKSYIAILDESKKAVINPDLGLILLHLPVPHPPGFYDIKKSDYSISRRDYLENLVLADHTLGELRSSMESSGNWEKTTVIITSDHWLRTDNKSKLDHRVPFMIKLAGQKECINYEHAFNTVLTHDLILALLNNELSTSDDVAEWIDNKRLNLQIPTYKNSKNINSSPIQ